MRHRGASGSAGMRGGGGDQRTRLGTQAFSGYHAHGSRLRRGVLEASDGEHTAFEAAVELGLLGMAATARVSAPLLILIRRHLEVGFRV
jgi:hypothetical protein